MNPFPQGSPEHDEWERQDAADPFGPDEEKPGKKSAATILVELARERYVFGISDVGDTFGVPKIGPTVVFTLRGGKTSLRAQLSKLYLEKFGKVAGQQALADALLVIEGVAQEADPRPLHLRVAERDGDTWLDLGDQTGAAVRITTTGWAVEDAAPVLFRRTSLTAALPRPEQGGDLGQLWEWLNIAPEDRPLVAAWLVATLISDIPHPVLGLFGEQGTGKTTAEKLLVSLIDPSPVPTRKTPKDAEAWITAASGSWVVGLDNLSDVSGWLSDALCRAVTGDGDIRRRLYTDADFAVFAFRRAIIICGIDLGALNGDLADRMLTVDLDVIPEEDRLRERDLWPMWSEVHPRLLGALLDLAARVKATLPSVRLAKSPRMADFAHVLAAVDSVLGTAGFERYMDKQRTLATDSLTGDPFTSAAMATIEKKPSGSFVGTSAELLDLVTPTEEKWKAPRGWPTTARAVTQRLRRQAPVLRKARWSVEDDGGENHANAIRWTITAPSRTRDAGKDTSHDSRDSQEGVGREYASNASEPSGPSQDEMAPEECAICGQALLLREPGREICERCRRAAA